MFYGEEESEVLQPENQDAVLSIDNQSKSRLFDK